MLKSTMGMNYRMLSANLETMSNKMFDLRQQSATGKEMNRPSDNPAGIRPVLHYRVQGLATERYMDHIAVAEGEMAVQDSSLDQAENIMAAAKETLIAARNGGANEMDLDTHADRVGQLFEEMLQAANTQTSGKYVYAGYQEATPPFTVNSAFDPDAYNPDDPSTRAVVYHGDGNAKSVEIATEKQVQTSLTGNDLFLGDADNDGVLDAGGIDLFSTLKNVEAAIRSGDDDAMNEGLDNLEQGADQVRRLRGRMGNNAWRIERAGRHMNAAAIEFKEIISGYEDADVLEVFSNLVQHETAFEAALNVTSRVSRLSILDFM